MSQQEIKKLEKLLQSYKNNLEFSKKSGNRIRQTRHQGLISDMERQIKDAKRDNAVEDNLRLRGIIDELKAEIKELDETNKKTKEDLETKKDEIDKILHPEKYLKSEPKSEPEPEEKIPCPDCGKMVRKIGMTTHLSRWCKGEVAIS